MKMRYVRALSSIVSGAMRGLDKGIYHGTENDKSVGTSTDICMFLQNPVLDFC